MIQCFNTEIKEIHQNVDLGYQRVESCVLQCYFINLYIWE